MSREEQIVAIPRFNHNTVLHFKESFVVNRSQEIRITKERCMEKSGFNYQTEGWFYLKQSKRMNG